MRTADADRVIGPALRTPLTTLLRATRDVYACAANVGDRAATARLARRIARIERHLAALPTAGAYSHPN